MALGDGSVWDESNPQQSTFVNQGPLYETDFKVGVRSRMAQEHVWPSSQSATSLAGQHTYISLQGQTGTPVMPLVGTTTQAGMLYANTNYALLYQNATGGVKTVINSAGSVNIVGASYSSTGTLGEMVVGTSGGTLVILTPATTQGMILISTTASPGVGWSNTAGFGVWAASNAGTNQATSDGFYIVSANIAGGNILTFSIYSDGNSNPSTIRARNVIYATGGTNMYTLMSPVRSGDYYSAVASGGSVNTAYFLPLGV